jgi:hypothetical protein
LFFYVLIYHFIGDAAATDSDIPKTFAAQKFPKIGKMAQQDTSRSTQALCHFALFPRTRVFDYRRIVLTGNHISKNRLILLRSWGIVKRYESDQKPNLNLLFIAL